MHDPTSQDKAKTQFGNIQKTQAPKTSKCATSNRCDWVVVQGPAREVCEKSCHNVTVRRYIQFSQAAKTSECTTCNRCDLVADQVPAQATREESHG
jgi:hypothetical protein